MMIRLQSMTTVTVLKWVTLDESTVQDAELDIKNDVIKNTLMKYGTVE